MPMGRPKADLVLDSAELAQLQSMVRSRSIPAALRARADRIGEREWGAEQPYRCAPGLHPRDDRQVAPTFRRAAYQWVVR